MKCRKCGCPGAAELFVGMMCFNPKCIYFDKDAVAKATWDNNDYTVNNDAIFDLRRFLDADDSSE